MSKYAWLYFGVLVLVCLLTLVLYNTSELLSKYSNKYTKQFDKHATEQNGPERNQQPNILVIITDDQGYNDVGYNGNTKIKTPVIDKLAKDGLILDNYYVQPICTPTRGQLFSGVHQIHTGLSTVIFPGERVALPLNFPIIAEKLKDAGYSTHLVGKWHLGYYSKKYLPTNRGFDSFFGILNGHSDHFNYKVRSSGKGFDLHEGERNANMSKYEGRYSTHLFAEKAINIVDEHRNGTKPLFLVVTFTAPHKPHQVPKSYKLMYNDTFKNSDQLQTYAGMLTCLDEAVGNITDAFKRNGLWDNTVMIYSSDNGAPSEISMSNAPLRGHKGNVFEGGVKVPGFVHSNLMNKTVKGTISKELLHVSDWFPTLARIGQANINDIKQLYGYDVKNTILEGHGSPRTEVLHYIRTTGLVLDGELKYNNTFDSRINAAIRIGDWKLITNPPDKMADRIVLFNIKDDPRERHNLSKRHPEKVLKMLDRLEHHRRTSVPQLDYVKDQRANPERHDHFWGPWL